ncbi:MAG: hypothetical protein M3Y25_02210, partial [Thermoproteota archaeon]|nr:hypothetical protein [Thermoproteota archaeon]
NCRVICGFKVIIAVLSVVSACTFIFTQFASSTILYTLLLLSFLLTSINRVVHRHLLKANSFTPRND